MQKADTQKFDANDDFLTVERGEQIYQVRFPGGGEISEYLDNLSTAKPEEVLGVLHSFLEKLGLPREVSASISLRKLKSLAQLLCDIEKKS